MQIHENEIVSSIEKLKSVLQSKDNSDLSQLNTELKELLNYLNQYIKDNQINNESTLKFTDQFEMLNEIFKLDTYNCVFNYIYKVVSARFEEHKITLKINNQIVNFEINGVIMHSMPRQQLINYVYHNVYQQYIPIEDVIKLIDILISLYGQSQIW